MAEAPVDHGGDGSLRMVEMRRPGRHSSTSVLIAAIVAVLTTACGGGSRPEAPDGEPTNGEPQGTIPGLCVEDPGPSFPDDVGASCPAGSNRDLCLMNVDDFDLCSSGHCLWDAKDPAGDRAYCTLPCSAGDPTGCPAGFDCRVDECDAVAVCVRTEVVEIAARQEIEAGVFPTPYYVYWVATGEDGTVTWAASDGAVIQRGRDGVVRGGGAIAGNRGVIGLAAGGVTYLVPDANVEQLARIRNGSIKVREIEGMDVEGVFRAKDGTIYYLGRDVFTERRASLIPIDQDLADDATRPRLEPTGRLVPMRIVPLVDHGFVGSCAVDQKDELVPCASADGIEIVELELPGYEGSAADLTALRRNRDPSRLWFSGLELGRWEDGGWRPAGLPDLPVSAVVPLGPGPDDLLLFAAHGDRDDAFVVRDGCWRALHQREAPATFRYDASSAAPSLVALDGGTVGWIVYGGDLVRISLDLFE
jgi:hypothetical protein